MAPIKFEEQLKDKLEQRSIQPNPDAWNKLNDRLDNHSKSSNKGFWWLGIAATIVGVLLALTFVFKYNTEIVEPTVVDVENKSEIINPESQKSNSLETENMIAQEKPKAPEAVENNSIQVKENAAIKSLLKEKQKAITSENKVTLAQTDIEIKELEEVNEVAKTNSNVIGEKSQKVNDVIAQLKEFQKESYEVSDSEIDSLLYEAQREIKFQNLIKEAIQTVDAEDLLRSVEEDLDDSFRMKVFNALKSGYNSVKTAVAERNN